MKISEIKSFEWIHIRSEKEYAYVLKILKTTVDHIECEAFLVLKNGKVVHRVKGWPLAFLRIDQRGYFYGRPKDDSIYIKCIESLLDPDYGKIPGFIDKGHNY
jgi:hypothetical protein